MVVGARQNFQYFRRVPNRALSKSLHGDFALIN